jgi:CheY-like chemotaxis protein
MVGSYHPEIPVYHPCTALLLDDDEDFLASLKAVLGRDAAVLGYSSPGCALKCLARAQAIAEDTFDVFERYSAHAEGAGAEVGDHLLLLKSSRLRRLANSGTRFEMISVVIVDQVMPSTSGLEFCASIADMGVKTILLTGQMSDEATIRAFNDGLIDRFVSKNDPDALKKIKSMMGELHRDYMADKLEPLTKALRASGNHSLDRFDTVELMRSIRSMFPYSEYYYLPNSRGFLLRDIDGQEQFCLLGSAREQSEMADVVEDMLGPCDEAEGLRRGNLIAWDFFDDFGDGEPWHDRLDDLVFPCRKVGDLVWSLIPAERLPYRIGLSDPSWEAYRARMQAKPINWIGGSAA